MALSIPHSHLYRSLPPSLPKRSSGVVAIGPITNIIIFIVLAALGRLFFLVSTKPANATIHSILHISEIGTTAFQFSIQIQIYAVSKWISQLSYSNFFNYSHFFSLQVFCPMFFRSSSPVMVSQRYLTPYCCSSLTLPIITTTVASTTLVA